MAHTKATEHSRRFFIQSRKNKKTKKMTTTKQQQQEESDVQGNRDGSSMPCSATAVTATAKTDTDSTISTTKKKGNSKRRHFGDMVRRSLFHR